MRRQSYLPSCGTTSARPQRKKLRPPKTSREQEPERTRRTTLVDERGTLAPPSKPPGKSTGKSAHSAQAMENKAAWCGRRSGRRSSAKREKLSELEAGRSKRKAQASWKQSATAGGLTQRLRPARPASPRKLSPMRPEPFTCARERLALVSDLRAGSAPVPQACSKGLAAPPSGSQTTYESGLFETNRPMNTKCATSTCRKDQTREVRELCSRPKPRATQAKLGSNLRGRAQILQEYKTHATTEERARRDPIPRGFIGDHHSPEAPEARRERATGEPRIPVAPDGRPTGRPRRGGSRGLENLGATLASPALWPAVQDAIIQCRGCRSISILLRPSSRAFVLRPWPSRPSTPFHHGPRSPPQSGLPASPTRSDERALGSLDVAQENRAESGQPSASTGRTGRDVGEHGATPLACAQNAEICTGSGEGKSQFFGFAAEATLIKVLAGVGRPMIRHASQQLESSGSGASSPSLPLVNFCRSAVAVA